MGNNAIGASLEIPQSVLNKLNEVDKKLQGIATTADNMSKSVIASFNNIGTQAVDNLLTKINQLQSGIGGVDFGKMASGLGTAQNSMKGTALEAERAANMTAKLVSELSKVPKDRTSIATTIGSPTSAVSSTTTYMAYSKQIENAKAQMDLLIKSTREYELTMQRFQSGKGGYIPANAKEEYNANLRTIESLRQQISLLQNKQQTLINNVQLERQQEQIQANIRNFVTQQQSLPEQRKNDELRKMNEYYKQEEINSAKAAKQAEREATSKERAREREERANQKALESQERLRIAQEKANQRAYLGTAQGALSMENKSIAQRIAQNKQLIIARDNLKKAMIIMRLH
jgi:hypothetical protein